MEKKSLVIINNEKVFDEDGQFYCSNYDMMATPEALNNYYSVQFIVRNSKKKGGNKLNLENVKIGYGCRVLPNTTINKSINNKKAIIAGFPPKIIAYD